MAAKEGSALYILVLMVVCTHSLISTFQEIPINLEIFDISFFPSILVIAGKNVSSQTSFVMSLNLQNYSLEAMGPINNSYLLLGNQFNSLNSNDFLVYDSSIQILLSSQNFSNWQSLSTDMLSQPVFSSNASCVYWLSPHQVFPTSKSINQYSLTLNSLNSNGMFTLPSNPSLTSHNGYIYLSYIQTQTFYLDGFPQGTTSLSPIMSYPTTAASFIVKCFGDLLIVSLQTSLTFYNISASYVQVDAFTMGTGSMVNFQGTILDFSCIGTKIALTTNTGILIQYDFILKQVLNSTQSAASKIYYLNQTHLFFWDTGATSIFISREQPIAIDQNIAVNVSIPNTVNAVNQTTQEDIPFWQKIRGIWKREYSQIAGKVMIISSLKSFLNFLVPLISFLEEFWLYKFHRWKYPDFFQVFTEQISIINYYRLSPPFEVSIPKNYEDWASQQNQQYRKSIYKSNKQQFSSQTTIFYMVNLPNLVISIIMNVIFYIAGLVILLIMFFLSFFFEIFNKIKNGWKKRMKPMSLLVAILDSNILLLTFQLFLQVNHFFRFNYLDRYSLAASSVLIMIISLYSGSGYIFVRICDPTTAKNVITFSKFCNKGLFIQLIILLFIKFSKAIIHGLLLDIYEIQILCICLTDFLSVVVIIIFRNFFINKKYFWIYLAYQIVVFFINTIFFVEAKLLQLDKNLMQELDIAIMIALLCLLLITCVKFILIIHHEFAECWTYMYSFLTKKKEKQNCPQNIFANQEVSRENVQQIRNTKKIRPQHFEYPMKISPIGIARCSPKNSQYKDKKKQMQLQLVLRCPDPTPTISEYQLSKVMKKPYINKNQLDY